MNMNVDPCAGPGLRSIASVFEAIVTGAHVSSTETVPLARVAGRITASPVQRRIQLPRFDQSAMDFYGLHDRLWKCLPQADLK